MIYSVILAAGKSRRFGKNLKKQFIKINNKPIFEYSVDKFLKIKKIGKLILVIDKIDKKSFAIKNFIKKYHSLILSGKIVIITGGNERYDSVYNSLLFIENSCCFTKSDIILIHDSARPCVSLNDVDSLINYAKKCKVITLGSKINDTIKSTKVYNKNLRLISDTVDRDMYTLVSTPQAFNLNLLISCYDKFYKIRNKSKFTDDIQIIEKFSSTKPYVLLTNNINVKITTQNDLNMVKYLL